MFNPLFKMKFLLKKDEKKELKNYFMNYVWPSGLIPELKIVPKKGCSEVTYLLLKTRSIEVIKELRALRDELSNKYKFYSIN